VQTRTERDSMGSMEVPADAYYGAQTERARRNFEIGGLRFPRAFLRALGLVKKSAARVNVGLGLLDARLGGLIEEAAQEVVDGRLDGWFPSPAAPTSWRRARAGADRPSTPTTP